MQKECSSASTQREPLSLNHKLGQDNSSKANKEGQLEESDVGDKIALKRKEGLNRLLMQLESDNRHLRTKLASQKAEFEKQTEEYVQKRNRKVGKLKVQVDELQERLRDQIAANQELEARLRQTEG